MSWLKLKMVLGTPKIEGRPSVPKILGLAGVPAVGVPKGSSTCQRTSTWGRSPWTGLKWLVVLRGSSRVPFSLLFVFLSRVSFLLLLKSVLVCCSFVFFHLLICCSSLFHARSSLHPSSGIPLVLVCLPRRTITLWTTAKMDADFQSSFGSLSIRFSVS